MRGKAGMFSRRRDDFFSSVSLLLHMDGSNASTTFTDSSANAFSVTASGNAQISTAHSKFGGASALFDGTGDYLTMAANSEVEFGDEDFTIECWYYPLSAPSPSDGILSKGEPASEAEDAWGLWFYNGELQFYSYVDNENNLSLLSDSDSINLNAWNHVAVVRQGSVGRLFMDGVQRAEKTGLDFSIPTNASGPLIVGSNWYDTTEYSFDGYIDDLRITKGVARYAASFTPPTAAFPDY